MAEFELAVLCAPFGLRRNSMTDNKVESGDSVSPKSVDDRFARIEKVVRWAFWILVAGTIVWVFADLLIHH